MVAQAQLRRRNETLPSNLYSRSPPTDIAVSGIKKCTYFGALQGAPPPPPYYIPTVVKELITYNL